MIELFWKLVHICNMSRSSSWAISKILRKFKWLNQLPCLLYFVSSQRPKLITLVWPVSAMSKYQFAFHCSHRAFTQKMTNLNHVKRCTSRKWFAKWMVPMTLKLCRICLWLIVRVHLIQKNICLTYLSLSQSVVVSSVKSYSKHLIK